MTLAEFDLFLQQLPYFYQQHGITTYVAPQCPNEEAYERFQFRAWSSNIKTHRLEIVFTGVLHKDLDYNEVFEIEENVMKYFNLINPDGIISYLNVIASLPVCKELTNCPDCTCVEFTNKFLDILMNMYLECTNQNDAKVYNYILRIMLNKNVSLIDLIWKYITNIRM